MLKDFSSLKISISSPQDILANSHGEVTRAETINYRTQRAEPDGLMCEKIFGPTKNFECYCGKYKKIRYKGIICDKCGVEVTHKRVRRERMGHIKLASPVVHVWYAHGTPNKLAIILDIPPKKLEGVIYFSRHLVVAVDEDKRVEKIEKLEEKLQERLADMKSSREQDIENLREEYEIELKQIKKEKNELKLVQKNAELNKEIANLKAEYDMQEKDLRDANSAIKEILENISVGDVLAEDELDQIESANAKFFKTEIGAEAVITMLKKVHEDMDAILKNLEKQKEKAKSVITLKKLVDRYRILKGMKDSNLNPEWLVMEHLPVIPPELRPIVQLQGGRFATSDLNDLYRRVINRNNRLKKLIDLGAPEIIIRNEKRMLQESVDALLDNNHRVGNPVLNTRQQPYKSLSDMLRGKTGRFRQNLLGKRVDYSARAVIVGGPELYVNQCGLPQDMALELFKPFIIRELIARGIVANAKSGKTYIDEKNAEVYEILEEVIQGRPVLLNRAPTLHKQGIQAFYPVLISGNAIQIPPVVCKGFNADFDGDQMSVHVPLSKAAVDEAIAKMMPDSNVLLMRDGSPIIFADKDMIAGNYYLTRDADTDNVVVVSDYLELMKMLDLNQITSNAKVKLNYKGDLVETTAGRILFNESLPQEYEFINKQANKGLISDVVSDIYSKYGANVALETIDKIQKLGFKWLTNSGVSISISDYKQAPNREEIIAEANKREDALNKLLDNGLVSASEKLRLSAQLWTEVNDNLAEMTLKLYDQTNPITLINKSGAIAITEPLKSSASMKGLILDLHGSIVPLPLRSNYVKGFTTFEYFASSRGTRKGEADKKLKTPISGYITRKLCDVSQDMITRIDDCGTKKGIYIYKDVNRRLSFERRISGRVVAEDIILDDKVILNSGEIINEELSKLIAEKFDKVKVRSVLTCEAKDGLCTKCYGANLGTRKLVEKGVAVGIIAGQAMGESTTQLTIDSKHTGAKAGTKDITQGIPRLQELFECRVPKMKALIAEISGTVKILEDDVSGIYKLRIENTEEINKEYKIQDDDEVQFSRSKKVKKAEVLIIKKDGTKMAAPTNGEVSKKDGVMYFTGTKNNEVEYKLDKKVILRVKDGDSVVQGQQLSEGSIYPPDLLNFGDLQKAEQYLIDNIQEVYGVQGIAIDDKHVEIVVRKMGGLVKIVDAGDSFFIPGEFESYNTIRDENEKLKSEGKDPIKYTRQLLGISQVAVKSESFLSAASFQEQVRVLSDSALVGSVDHLKGLKENVIIGRVVPLGSNVW
ncbi:DNA-directed RNA polymerase subunit beta' [bacterium]|nr:MAG: DNA-directed RNA polymerase subunit beta' [bacterium]